MTINNPTDARFAQQVIATLRGLGIPDMMVSGDAQLEALRGLLAAAQAEAGAQATPPTACAA